MAVGWGTTSSGGSVSTSLRQVTMSTIAATASMCVSVLNDVTRQFCAGIQCGGRGEIVLKDSLIYCLRYLCVIDTCQGDSGGPIMIFTASNQWVIVGVTSYGIGCAGASYAGVYTRIAYYQNWISSTMSGGVPVNPTSSNYIVSTVISSCITQSTASTTGATVTFTVSKSAGLFMSSILMSTLIMVLLLI